jgi:hypothetical protein
MESEYQELMQHLFRHMQIALPPEQRNDVYTVGVDNKLTLKFFMAPDKYLNVTAVIGELPADAGPSFLIKLLNLNAFTPLYPNFNYKVGVAPQTRNVELWMREPLKGLKPEKLIELFDNVVDLAAYVKGWMERPAPRKTNAHTANILSKRHASL